MVGFKHQNATKGKKTRKYLSSTQILQDVIPPLNNQKKEVYEGLTQCGKKRENVANQHFLLFSECFQNFDFSR